MSKIKMKHPWQCPKRAATAKVHVTSRLAWLNQSKDAVAAERAQAANPTEPTEE